MSTVTSTITKKEMSQKGLGDKSLVGSFNLNDVLIPDNAGTGLTKWRYQRRTLVQYACLAATGLTTFYKIESPALRAVGLSCLFPGAGLVAVFTIPSIIAFLVSMLLLPVCLFAWFGMGGVAFPIFLWIGTTLLSALLARDSVLEVAGPLWIAICVGGISYLTYATLRANAEARQKRGTRNEYLVNAVRENQTSATTPKAGTRELDETSLRFLQWIIELGLAPMDDWSYHDIIDQFQTSAIRYQLYEAVSGLGIYQSVYCPNFHGYTSQAQRNLIEKSLLKKVMEFWKYESMAGKFNAHDWDPCKKDNIMVTGYILQAIGIYQSTTHDDRYTKKDCLVFEVTDKLKFKYDLQSLAEAVHRNMDQAAYCLYPCEPNWLYTMCNLVAMGGIVATDRLLGNKYGQVLKSRFEHSLETEFTEPDGTILPIRSELTGFTIPGLAGALADGVNSILCAAYLPHIAHRNWAFTKKEAIRYDENGRLGMTNLIGADKLDPGNYKAGEGCIRVIFAAAAAEFGDERLRKDLLKQVDEEYHPVLTTRTGALRNKGLSTLEQGCALRARISGYQDWTNMIQNGPPEHTFKAPVLESVPFPEVLVAKAYSQDGESVDLVFYPGKQPGNFKLGFKRMLPGATYTLAGQSQVANSDGTAEFDVTINGRTATTLKLTART